MMHNNVWQLHDCDLHFPPSNPKVNWSKNFPTEMKPSKCTAKKQGGGARKANREGKKKSERLPCNF